MYSGILWQFKTENLNIDLSYNPKNTYKLIKFSDYKLMYKSIQMFMKGFPQMKYIINAVLVTWSLHNKVQEKLMKET